MPGYSEEDQEKAEPSFGVIVLETAHSCAGGNLQSLQAQAVHRSLFRLPLASDGLQCSWCAGLDEASGTGIYDDGNRYPRSLSAEAERKRPEGNVHAGSSAQAVSSHTGQTL